MPQECSEVSKATPSEDEDPFFCLLQDDSLITEIKVTTDRLLVPVTDDESLHDVVLIIHVMANYAVPTMNEFIFTQQFALRAYLDTLGMKIGVKSE